MIKLKISKSSIIPNMATQIDLALQGCATNHNVSSKSHFSWYDFRVIAHKRFRNVVAVYEG